MAESDFPGKLTAIIQSGRGLMSSTHCDRLQTADKPLYYNAMDFLHSLKTSRCLVPLFPMLKAAHCTSEGCRAVHN